MLKDKTIRISLEEILIDIIKQKNGDCSVAKRAMFWLDTLRKEEVSKK